VLRDGKTLPSKGSRQGHRPLRRVTLGPPGHQEKQTIPTYQPKAAMIICALSISEVQNWDRINPPTVSALALGDQLPRTYELEAGRNRRTKKNTTSSGTSLLSKV